MNDLLKQISSYNLFNYLLPGAVFCILLNSFFNYPLIPENIFAAAFFYYFVGLTISRVGSIAIEPILKFLRIIESDDYADFVDASRYDSKIEILSESNNTYRTLIALPICALIFHFCQTVSHVLALSVPLQGTILLFSILGLYILAYRKQSKYVSTRVEVALARPEK